MTQDTAPRSGRMAVGALVSRRVAARFAPRPVLEALEARELLSGLYTGLSAIRPVETSGGMYTLTVNGGGFERVKPAGGGAVAITLLGTTQASSLDVALTRPAPHKPAAPLKIASIKVNSGVLGGIQAAGTAALLGPLTPLAGGASTLQFASLGSNAQIDVAGSLGSLVAGAIALGPNGHVNVSGDLQQSLNIGALSIQGGQISIGNDLAGSLNVGTMSLTQGGRFLVGHDLTGSAQITGSLTANSNGLFAIADDLGALSVTNALNLDSGGQVAVGNDLTGPITVGGEMDISNSGKLTVGRDVAGSLNVTGDLNLASGGVVAVGRNLNAVTINGNFNVAGSGSALGVGGNLNAFVVNGAFVGKGVGSTTPDLSVGLDLDQLTVLGGGASQGGIQQANIDIGKSLLGLNIPHGIFNSFLTAGVSIQGGSTTPGGGNIGPDGADAIYNSEIRAGVEINQLEINGNVRSTFVTNPNSTGYPTRIIAGEDRAGQWSSGGVIDNFQITGQLIDSVVAASVAPYGGDGTYPKSGYGVTPPSVIFPLSPAPGVGMYDAPAGTITGGTVGAPIKYPNYSELSYYNEQLTGVSWSPINPTLNDTILPGGVNPSFASAPLAASDLIDPTTVLPLPTTSTILGGVVSNPHAPGVTADYAGIFAADTRGVFIGGLPS